MSDSINQNKLIAISDSIVDIDRNWFSKDLAILPLEKEKLDKYRADKKYVWFDPFYSPCIASIFCKKNNVLSRNILFFSMIEDNMLRVDLLPCKKGFDKFNYDKMAHQTEGQIYLFIYDEQGNLKAFFSHEIIYD